MLIMTKSTVIPGFEQCLSVLKLKINSPFFILNLFQDLITKRLFYRDSETSSKRQSLISLFIANNSGY